jgi:hypothetical protein
MPLASFGVRQEKSWEAMKPKKQCPDQDWKLTRGDSVFTCLQQDLSPEDPKYVI